MKYLIILVLLCSLFVSGCRYGKDSGSDRIIVFHAGSLSVPFRHLKADYEKKNPEVEILLEPAGSLICARKITELKKPCDIIASSDSYVINEILIPGYTRWNLRFATNAIVIAFTDRSRYSGEINALNWSEILLRDGVIYARSDPDKDPCGYRTVFTLMLAEKFYGKTGLADKILSGNTDFIRPKEVDLVALIESNAADYMFQYKSVAIQHGFKYIELPDEINLSDPAKSGIYGKVSLDITGSEPGTKITVPGDYINYSISVLENAPNKERAMDFLCFMLGSEGLEIIRKDGQEPILPFICDQPDQLPAELLKCLNLDSLN